MNELELFAGAGGGILASQLLGHRCVGAVEIDPYARAVLMARQDDGTLPPFPIWDDVRTFDGKPWRGVVDCVSGGVPCKGVSSARTNNPKRTTGEGLAHHETGLWREMLRVIREVEPAFARVENTARLNRHGLATILGDMAQLGFDARWDLLSGAALGAPHERKRTWIVFSHADRPQRQGGQLSRRTNQEHTNSGCGAWWEAEPAIRRVDDVLADRLGQLEAIGNGQIPCVAALAWETLKP